MDDKSAATKLPARGSIVQFVSGLGEVADRYDLVLCDVWGVLHDGLSAFPAASDALTRYRAGGGRVVLVSNAPRPGRVVAEQLKRLGVASGAYDEIRTSGDLTRAMVADHGSRTFHHIGPERDLGLFEGLSAGRAQLHDADYVVCTGLFDDETETVDDYSDAFCIMRERDLLMVCANPDIVVERGHRLILCAGALAAAFEDLGGRTLTPGKPHRPIYEAVLGVGADLLGRPLDRRRVLAIGDAIRTDIAGGQGAGLDTALVARGIHAAELDFANGVLNRAAVLDWISRQPFGPTMVMPHLTWSAAS